MSRTVAVENSVVEVDGVRTHYAKAGSGPALGAGAWVGGGRRGTGTRTYTIFGAISHGVWRWTWRTPGLPSGVAGLDAALEAHVDRCGALDGSAGHRGRRCRRGTRMGGAISMLLAARHPHRVRRLVLFAPANPFCTLGQSRRCGSMRRSSGVILPRWGDSVDAAGDASPGALERMYGDPRRIDEGILNGLYGWG